MSSPRRLHYTQFSSVFDVGSAEAATRADEIKGEPAAELDRDEGIALGFAMEVDHEYGPDALRLHSDDWDEPDHVVRFVLRCANALRLAGLWGFTWSLTCSKPCIELFGGGGLVPDLTKREAVASIDCARTGSPST